MSFLITILAFALAIGILVSIHEYGHYWVAKRCGVKVLTFSIGFGKPLLTWRRGEEQWQVAAIPLGGYVKMLNELEAPVAAAELDRAFNRQSPLKRIAIVVAGPLANFLLAILIYWAIFMGGVDITIPRIASVIPGSLAAQSGFSAGDTLLAIDNANIQSWAEAQLALLDHASANDRTEVTVKRADHTIKTLALDFTRFDKESIDARFSNKLGLSLDVTLIDNIAPGSPAQQAGLHVGDQMVAVEGKPTPDADSFVRAIQARPLLATQVSVLRAKQALTLVMTPKLAEQDGRRIGQIGAGLTIDWQVRSALRQPVSYGPVAALTKSLSQTWATSTFSLRMMWRMVTGHVSYKQLSGPVAIAKIAGQSAQVSLRAYLEFLCLISISLGVLNLLPVPVLDGGHLMYYSAELLRGRPVSERAMELGQRVGVGLLAALMVVALFNDISRLVGG